MASGFATVKEVVSGDTVVLIGQPRNGPPPEIRLTLASLQAPRLGSKGKVDEEAFAWESREFLRQLCIGKAVAFKVEYTVPTINRQFGSIRLNTGGTKGENVCVTVARAGWAKVKKESPNESERSGDFEEMVRVGDIAEQRGLGIYNKDPVALAGAIRKVQHEVENPNELLQKIKGIPQRALIEFCRDGGSFKILLLQQMAILSFNLAGVQCPRLGGGESGDGPQPFGPEARYFTEMRLLNREVNVVINGVDEKFNTFYGSIQHPAGDISVELIKNGLARAVDWSMNFTTMDRASAMRAAAREAKAKKLRIWKNFTPPKISGDKVFSGVIAEVISGDTVIVRVGTPDQLQNTPWECEERRVSCSSIRTPRIGAKSRNEPDQPFAVEAKEILRSRIVGKKCDVSVEYERQPPEGAVGPSAQVRKFASIIVHLRKGKKNVALLVLEEGCAEVLRHRADDERSAHYDALLLAEAAAKEKQIGIHNPKVDREAPVQKPKVIDLTSKAEQARAYLPSLQSKGVGNRKAGQHRAFVEYVHNGSRLRLFIPNENIYINFAVGGILCPQTARVGKSGKPATEAQPYSTEALIFTKALVLQKEVTIEIESMDKGGTLIGQCFIKKGADRKSLAISLLEQGLAYVNDFSIRFTSCGDELQRVEEQAKKAKFRLWENYIVPEVDTTTQQNQQQNGGGTEIKMAWGGNGATKSVHIDSSIKLKTQTVIVSEINNGSCFFMQDQSGETKSAMAAIEKELADIGQKVGTTPGGESGIGIMEAKKNMNCLALFNDDGKGHKWFRAKIINISKTGAKEHVHIRYIDYGNEETVNMDRLRPAPQTGSLFKPAPVAQQCCLAFLKVPAVDKDFGTEAAMFLSHYVYGKECTAKIHPETDSEGRTRVSLYLPKQPEPECITNMIILEGLGYIDGKQIRYLKSEEEVTLVKQLKNSQEIAHKGHFKIWQYGDPRDDDETLL